MTAVPPYGPPQWQPGYPTPRPEPRNAFGITALVAALVGIIPSLMPITSFFAVMFGLVAVVFGLLGWGRVRRGVATNRGVTLSGLILGVLVVIFGIWSMSLFFGAMDKLQKDLSGIGANSAPPTTTRTITTSGQRASPPGTIGEGTWVVSTDIQPGTYRTAGPTQSVLPNCYWARLKDTSGELGSIVSNGNANGPTTVTIKPSDGAFKTSGCQPWTRTK